MSCIPRQALLLLLLVGVDVCGCASESTVVVRSMEPVQDQLLKIAAAYRQVNLDRGTPPRKPSDIEPLLQSRGAGRDVFISPRDHQPFKIAWGAEMIQLPVDPP